VNKNIIQKRTRNEYT